MKIILAGVLDEEMIIQLMLGLDEVIQDEKGDYTEDADIYLNIMAGATSLVPLALSMIDEFKGKINMKLFHADNSSLSLMIFLKAKIQGTKEVLHLAGVKYNRSYINVNIDAVTHDIINISNSELDLYQNIGVYHKVFEETYLNLTPEELEDLDNGEFIYLDDRKLTKLLEKNG